MEITEYHRNSHAISFDNAKEKIVLMSDLHWDNPKCDRLTLKKHLDKAKEMGAKVIVNGDFFCLMQGKYDPRRNKNDIRPEHNKPNYIDAVILDAVEWFGPYKDTLIFTGYGNHETGIIKNLETDPLQRFADMFNFVHKPEIPLKVGGYGGWITLQMTLHKTSKISARLYYFHGSGGGGPVTRGVIQNQRQMADTDGADMIWMGHVHELYTMYQSKKSLHSQRMVPILKEVLHIRTSTYKEEHGDGYMGWHIERGAPPKPIGAVLLELEAVRKYHPQLSADTKDRVAFIDIVPTIWTDKTA